MNALLRNAFRIFWKNKLYFILAGILLTLFLVGQFSEKTQRSRKAAHLQTVTVQTKLKNAEESFQKIFKNTASVEAYFKEHPGQALLLNYMALLVFILLLYGLWLEGWCLIRKMRKQPLLETLPFKEQPRWSIGDVFRVMILFLGFSVLIGFIAEFAHKWDPKLFNGNGQLILHGTLADITAVVLVIFFTSIKYGQNFFKIQIRKENFWKDIWIGVSAYLAVLPMILGVLLLLVWIVSLFHYEPPPQKIMEVFIEEGKRNPLLIAYTTILAAIIGPILEEIFFRGFFYSALRNRYAAIPCALITSTFFALLHESAFAFLPVFLLGLLLAYVYERRKSLVAPIALHVLHNSLFVGYFFLMKQNFLDRFLH